MDKHKVYELQAEVYKVLSNPTRLMIIDCIGKGEKTVSEIVSCLGLSKSNISQHLNYMKAVGMVCSRKEGKRVYYYLSDPRLLAYMEGIKQVLFDRFVRCGQLIGTEELKVIWKKQGL